MITTQHASILDEARIKQAALHYAFLSSSSSSIAEDCNIYCFIRREHNLVSLVYGSRIGDYIFPLATYTKELSYLASLPHSLLRATISTAIKALFDHGDDQLAKQFAL